MSYALVAIVLLLILNIALTCFNLKFIKELSTFIKEYERVNKDDSHIHGILNNRLLELQSKKYALQRKKRYE